MDDPVLHHVQALIDQLNSENNVAPDMVAQALVITVLYDSAEGVKYYRSLPSKDLRTWEAMGLMEFQNMQFQANIVQQQAE